MKKEVLPKDQWLSPEDDGAYLSPFLEEVTKEMLQKKEWDRD